MKLADLVLLDIGLGDEPPTEFRVFTAGTVVTSKGRFTFDEKAAKSVMAAYHDQGNELMVDYDHASLLPLSLDPALSGRAAGWFGLELRNGELWAVNVRWTEPASEALRRKEWRYMSPAFRTDGKRIAALINVALTNIPATKRLEPLMAASAVTEEKSMDLSTVLAALGLSADATEENIKAKVAELSAAKTHAPAPAALPAPIADAALDQIVREAHHDVHLQNEISSLREQQRLSQVREILRTTDRYTTPAFESLAMTRTPDDVRSMLAGFPQKPRALSAPIAKTQTVELTASDMRVCRLLSQDPNELKAFKAQAHEREQQKLRARSVSMALEMEDM
jgi:hypothetical protein